MAGRFWFWRSRRFASRFALTPSPGGRTQPVGNKRLATSEHLLGKVNFSGSFSSSGTGYAPQPDTNLIAVTGCSSAKFPACGFCVCGMSKKPTPLMIATAPSCFHSFVGLPQLVSNFLRAATIALRSWVFFGKCRGHLRDQVTVGVEEN
jgi:hypothetical protein